ncbi:hypothetical protein NO108_04102 [Planktothrix rubescens]|nr:hypothetical protein NO108_04102 [Planktothrix rubescens]
MVSLWDFMKLSKTHHNTIKLFCKSSIVYLATNPKNPQIIYGVNQQNAVFHSSDGGKIWHSL